MCILFTLTSCKRTTDSKETVITIDGEEVKEPEIRIYLMQVRSRFEQLAGPDVWEYEDFSEGRTAEEVARQGTLDNLIQIKLLVHKAAGMGIELNDEMIQTTKQYAVEYYTQMDKEYIQKYDITQELVENVFLESKLANEVKLSVLNSYQPSDQQIEAQMLKNEDYAMFSRLQPEDALRKVRVQYIFVQTAVDEDGVLTPLSEEAQAKAYDQIKEAYDLAIKGYDFEALINIYSQDEQKESTNGTFDLPLAYLSDELSLVLSGLNVGDISEIAKTETGYHLFKVIDYIIPTEEEISTYKVSFNNMEEQLRTEAVNKLREEAFQEIYNDWKEEAEYELNQDLWNQILIFEE